MPLHSATELEEIQKQINAIHPSWTKRPAFTRVELGELLSNRRPLAEIDLDDWRLLTKYMAAIINPEWGKFWQPDNRGQFIAQINDVLTHADKWQRECIRRKVSTQILASE